MFILGHRGDPSRQPENTMKAFQAAFQEGSDGIELDARRTRDGVIVISHDPTVDRCTTGRGAIKDMTFAALESLDAGQGAQVPTLSSVLDWAHGRLPVNIHINNNDHDYPGIEQQIVDMVRGKGMVREVMLSSFDTPTINQLKMDNPDIRMGLLTDVHPMLAAVKQGVLIGTATGLALGLWLGPGSVVTALAGAVLGGLRGLQIGKAMGDARSLQGTLDSPCDVLNPFWANVSARWVRDAHAAGKTVIPYTVNNPLVRRWLAVQGVDGVMSDNPARLLPSGSTHTTDASWVTSRAPLEPGRTRP